MSDSARSPAAADVLISGKCIQVRKSGETWLHLVSMPAPDPYSHPSTVEVAAAARLCDRDEPFSARCRISGYARTYKTVDRDSGETRTVRTADVRLSAVA